MSDLLSRHLKTDDAVAAFRRRQAQRAGDERAALARRVAADVALFRLGLDGEPPDARTVELALRLEGSLRRELSWMKQVELLTRDNAELTDKLEALARKVATDGV